MLNIWTWRLLAAIWGALLFAFFGFRLVFFLMYNSQFENSGSLEILVGFIHGLRFDLAVIFAFTGLPAVVFLLLSPWRYRRVLFWIFFAYVVVAGTFMFAIAGVDLFYFNFVRRRISFELVAMLNDWRPVLALIRDAFWMQVLGVTVVLLGLLYLMVKRIRLWVVRPFHPVPWWSQSAQLVALFFLTAFLVRGGIQAKPLSVGMAYRTPNTAVGHLTLNAVYTGLRSSLRKQVTYLKYYPDPEALQVTQKVLQRQGGDYPLLQHQQNPPLKKPKNLVILVVESFSAQLIGALGGKQGVTVNLDQLAAESLLFNNFYASGTRSLEGVATVVTGFPALPTGTLIGGAFQQSTVSSLPWILKQHGYSTFFLHGAFKGSMWFDSFAQRIGFDRYISKEDFPNAKAISDSAWGVFDHFALERFHQEIAATRKPFFAYYFSLSPHTPFELPHPRFKKFGPETPNARLFNAISYADYSLGRFFELARKSDYWRNTVFMITADHHMGGARLNSRERMWIPLFILSPGDPEFPRGTINATMGSQVDIAPTALELLGISSDNAFIGTSLLHPQGRRFALFGWGNQAGWLSENGLLVHDTEKAVVWYPLAPRAARPKGLGRGIAPPANLPETREMQSLMQTLNNLMLRNRLAPPQK